VERALEYRGEARVGCIGGANVGDDGADVAQPGEQTVELRLVSDLSGDGGRAVVVAAHVEVAEPVRPVVVKVAVDADGVCLGGGVHGSGWVC